MWLIEQLVEFPRGERRGAQRAYQTTKRFHGLAAPREAEASTGGVELNAIR